MINLPDILPYECLGCRSFMTVLREKHTTIVCEKEAHGCKCHEVILKQKEGEKNER